MKIPEKSKDKKKEDLAKVEKTLKEFLDGYKPNFSTDIDELWKAQDKDGNGFLDKAETLIFLD
jgi:hypothetical protein